MSYLIILICIIVLFIIFLFVVSNYFIDESLTRKKVKDINSKKQLFNFSKKSLEKIKENKKLNEEWLSTIVNNYVYISSYGVKLAANVINNNSNNFVILLHGYMGKKEEMLHFARWYYSKGYNVLLPDLRCHGKSGGYYIGMGYTDRLDILNWISYIRQLNSKARIILHGHSMGAAAALFTCGENPDGVLGCVADCSYTSVYDVFGKELKELYHMPKFPVLYLFNIIFKHKKNSYSLKDASVLDYVEKSRIPTLFIHGENDTFLPVEMSNKLYNRCKARKKLVVVSKAGHAQSELEDSKKYFREIEKFFKI